MMISDIYNLYLKASGRVYTDTRKIDKPGGLFFSLSGDNFNGNKFAEKALELGCRAAIIDDKTYLKGNNYVLCTDSLKCLQDLARLHRAQLDIPVIAITGSNGKTTTKEITHAILSNKYRVKSTAGNYNNHIGVPLTLLSIRHDDQIAIVELGTNHPGEIKFLAEMADPTAGLISSIGKAHLEGLGNLEGVAKEKLSLFDYLINKGATIFLNTDSPYLVIDKTVNYENAIKYSGGQFANEELSIKRLFPIINATCKSNDETLSIKSNLYGEHNLLNIIAAMTIGLHHGVPPEKMVSAVSNLNLNNNRTETINYRQGTIYLDAYNANPTSMAQTIRSFAQSDSKEKWLIIGDMFELGQHQIEEHQLIVELILEYEWKKLVLVGEIFGQTKYPAQIESFKTFSECKAWFNLQELQNQEILIKASRGIGLERLVRE